MLFAPKMHACQSGCILGAHLVRVGKLNLSSHDLVEIRSVQPVLRRIASRGQSLDKRRRILSTPNGIKAIKKLFTVLQSYF